MMEQRKLCLKILERTIRDSTYTNLSMRNELSALPLKQRPFCVELINGVLRKYLLLNHQFEEYIRPNTPERLRIILAMAMYERFIMEEKEYAVVNEYVSLGTSKKERAFLNAVLRKATEWKMPEGNDAAALSIRCSMPLWITNLILAQYPEDAERILSSYQDRSKTYYRINHRKCVKEDLSSLPVEFLNEDIFVSSENLIGNRRFEEGYFYVQDVASNEIVKALDLTENSVFLDVCSAPGSKLFNALDIVRPENAYANDLHEHRVDLIREKAEVLGFRDIHLTVHDARDLSSVYETVFDRILIDAPCSGLGVLKRRPDIKFHITPTSLDGLVKLQKEILDDVSTLLKKDGILVYSTCTINRKENERQISSFLKDHPEFVLEEDRTLIQDEGDYFYYAKLKKV